MQDQNQPGHGAAGAATPATTAEIVERMTSRLANSLVIAAGILALGIYWSGDHVEAQTYQAVATPDGRVIRVNTESGSIVSCDATRCGLVWLQGDDLDRVGEEVGERVREAMEGREPGAQDPAAKGGQAPQQALPAPSGQVPQQSQPAPAPAQPQPQLQSQPQPER
ncbi:MAG TPA: hypothetical protein VGB79_08235 [Allosphingosinicella sp.]